MVFRLLFTCLTLVSASLVWAQSGYQIRPGDQLTVEVLEDPSLNRQVLVLPDGSVSFPLAGILSTTGKTTEQFRAELSTALAPNFATAPSVFVSVSALSRQATRSRSGSTGGGKINVYVLGEVNQPGVLEVRRGTTLLQSLALTGGFTKFAATKRIQLRRLDPQTGATAAYNFNYRAIESGASITGQTVLSNGDVIVVPQRRFFE